MAVKKRPRIAPRKPAAAASAAVQRFVEGNGKRGNQKRSAPGTRRYGTAEEVRITTYMSPELKKNFDLWCVENDTTGTAVISRLVEEFLADVRAK